MGNGQIVPVLLVEDDLEDIEIAERAFRKGRIADPLCTGLRDGINPCRPGAAEPGDLPQTLGAIGEGWPCTAEIADTGSEFDP